MPKQYVSKLDSAKLELANNYRNIKVSGVSFYINKSIANSAVNQDGLLSLSDDNNIVTFDVTTVAKAAITKILIKGQDGVEDLHSYQGGRIEVHVESINKAYICRAPGVQDKLRILEITSLEDKIPFFKPFLSGKNKEFDSQAYLKHESRILKKHQKNSSVAIPLYLEKVELFLKPKVTIKKQEGKIDKKIIDYAYVA